METRELPAGLKKTSIYFYYITFNTIMQEKLSKDFLESHLPSALKSFQKLLEANEGGQGFFVGKKVLEGLVNFSYSCIGIELPVVSLK